MNEGEEILVHVERFLRDDLAKESLSIEVEKSRQLLLDKLNKHLYSDENDVLRKRRQSSKKSKRWSCDIKHLSPENVSEDGASKRQSKTIEKKEANFYEKNFSFISGEQSDSADSYESMEDQKSLNSSQSDKKPDQKRFSKRTSKAKVDSELSTLDKNYEGQLYKKGKLNSWRKLHCVIFDRWLVCHTKDSKQLYRIKLQGYDATHQRSKEGGGKYEQEIRLTGPGLKTYIFYAKDKVEAELWVIELTKAIQRARDCSNNNNNNNNVTSTDSNYTPSNCLQEPENSYDVVDGSTVEQGTTATSSSSNYNNNNNNSNYNNNTKPSIFHNLINKVKQKAMAAFDSVENLNDKQQQQQHVSGILQVTFDDFSKPNWMQRFCVIRSKQLEVYKNNGNDRTEMVVPLSGVGLTLIPSSDFFVLCLNHPRQKMYIKFSNHSELNKWYQNLQRASQVLPEVPLGDADASLYDEIGESQGSTVQRPPVPECPPPMTPDVIGALMNMDEVGYMDVLECRQPILMDSNRRSQSRAYEEVSLYINRDTDCERSHKSATPTTTTSSAAAAVATSAAAPSCGANSNASKSFHYCPMWKGQSSGASSTASTSKSTTTTASASVARTTSTATSSGQSYFRSTVSTAPSTAGPPGPSIRSKVTGSLATDSSSTPSLKAKKLSDFNEAREKFLTSSSSSLSSKNKQQPQQAPSNPSPNKWTTNLSRGTASSSVSNNLDEVDSATGGSGGGGGGGSGSGGGCTLRQHDRSLSANRNSNPNLEADKRGSGCSLKSNIVQEKLKIFQKN